MFNSQAGITRNNNSNNNNNNDNTRVIAIPAH
jgi:hypothetical protein